MCSSLPPTAVSRAPRFSQAVQSGHPHCGPLRVIPLTGLTTPFLSAGGSSLLANWTIVAILLRISDHARRPVPDPNQLPPAAEAPTSVVSAP